MDALSGSKLSPRQVSEPSKPFMVTITGVNPKGLAVRFEDGTRAFLPYRELAWTEAERKNLLERLRPGQSIEVVVPPQQPGPVRDKIVSFKRTDFNFWQQQVDAFRGQEFMIRVESVTPTVAFGTVYWDYPLAGKRGFEIDGSFYFKELDSFIDEIDKAKRWRGHAYIVPGDVLIGKLQKVDHEREELELSISAYLKEIQKNPRSLFKKGSNDNCSIELDEGTLTKSLANREQLTLGGAVASINRIAIIDNEEEELTIAKRNLEESGYLVEIFRDPHAVREKLRQEDMKYDALFIDINLETDNDQEGIILAKEIQDNHQDIKIILISGENSGISPGKAAKGSGLSAYFYHKDHLRNWRDCLVEVDTTLPRPLEEFIAGASGQPRSVETVGEREHGPAASRDYVREALKQLSGYCEGSTAVIFAMHQSTLSCRLKLLAGPPKCPLKANLEHLSMLKFSPVKDCIIERKDIDTSEAQGLGPQQQKWHKWLLRFFAQEFHRRQSWEGEFTEYVGSYQSCLGFRLDYEQHGYGHALFWLHPEKNGFREEHRKYARLARQLMDTFYGLRGLREELIKARKLAGVGQTFQSLGHELSSHFLAIASGLENMRKLGETAESPEKHLQELGDIEVVLSRARNISETFQHFLSGKREEKFSLRKVIGRARKALLQIFPEVEVSGDPAKLPPKNQDLVLTGDFLALEQAIFNLLLNAAQQMDLCYRPQGMIRLSLEEEPDGWARIQIKDTGPGIHPRDFEKIFEEGVSTKKKGSGLGLAIARDIVEELGGTLTVSYSILLVSTCFEIRLPKVQTITRPGKESHEA
jgi:signal transduction histidine kinase/CheY-like chemotaxis protein